MRRLILILAVLWLAQAGALADVPGGLWIGQDGHDFVGPSSTLGASDVQDIHIHLSGVPTAKEIASATVNREGGGQWMLNGPWGPWKAYLERAPHADAADLYLEPSHAETPSLHIALRYADGTANEFDVKGARADVNLRMPGAALVVRWQGQDGQDWTGPGPAVGPDGRQDVHLALSHLSAHIALKSLKVEAPGPTAWQFGLNPERDWNAEVVAHPDDASQADLFFSPGHDLSGQTLTLKAVYANDKTDTATVAAGPCDPVRLMPEPADFPLRPNDVRARWLGQDSKDVGDRGDIHVALNHLPPDRSIVAATLSDPVGGLWTWPAADGLPLTVEIAPSGQTADLFFPPYRDEADVALTLRLTLDDGATTLVRFQGDSCDPYRRGALPAATRTTAHPGDDLQSLVTRFGTVTLMPGTYELSRPLVLDSAVTIRGAPGAVVRFAPRSDDSAPWSTAIEIRRSNTTLMGFTVRFASPVHWSADGNPAVLGTSSAGGGAEDPRVNIVVARMDLEGPPVPGPSDPAHLVASPFLMRFGDATSGRIIGNLLRGGTTDVTGGPWRIEDNIYHGAVPGTMAWDTFGGHYLHDLIVARNQLAPVPGSGKTWRFLVLTQWGARDKVLDNNVRGIGINDKDGIPNPNAPEIFLTEAYRLHYEGAARHISAGGRILQIPTLMDGSVRPGSVVAILSGPHAGAWFRIAQAVSPTVFVMEQPLPPGEYAISVSTGFVDETYARNVIDNRGGSSVPLDLAGTHFGTRIVGNHLLGGGEGLLLASTPTERPYLWGWSHVTFFGVNVSGNVVEDSKRGFDIDVDDNDYNKTSAGRAYVQATVRDNAVRWTAPFLRQWRQVREKSPPLAFRFGDRTRLDPAGFLLSVAGNVLQVPPGTHSGPALWIKSATVNGREQRDQRLSVPVLPLPARTVRPIRRKANSTERTTHDTEHHG